MSDGGKMANPVKKDRWAQCREFCREFWLKNPTASTHAAMQALNNARIDKVPHIVSHEHQAHLIRMGEKTNLPASMQSMQIHPAKPEVRYGPRLVIPPSPAEEKEALTMAVTDVRPTDPKVPTEQGEIARVARELRDVMQKYGIESCILTCTTSPKAHVDVDLTYKKANAWSIDL